MLFQSPKNNAQAYRLISKREYFTNLNKGANRESTDKLKLAHSYQHCPFSPSKPLSHEPLIHVENFAEYLSARSCTRYHGQRRYPSPVTHLTT